MPDPTKNLARAVERYAAARAARDDAIRDAHAGGLSYRKIGEVVGLSYARIAQVVNRR
jgi:hypothetical protein